MNENVEDENRRKKQKRENMGDEVTVRPFCASRGPTQGPTVLNRGSESRASATTTYSAAVSGPKVGITVIISQSYITNGWLVSKIVQIDYILYETLHFKFANLQRADKKNFPFDILSGYTDILLSGYKDTEKHSKYFTFI